MRAAITIFKRVIILALLSFFLEFALNFELPPLFLLIIDLIPLVNNVSECIRIITIPSVPLSLEVELGLSHDLILHNDLVLGEISLRVLDTDFTRPLRASLRIVSNSSTVGASAFPVFSDLLGLHTPTIPGVIDCGLYTIITCSLMGQNFLILLFQIPRCLLYVLWHVSQIYFCLFHRRLFLLSS